jgi:hypothetical protein
MPTALLIQWRIIRSCRSAKSRLNNFNLDRGDECVAWNNSPDHSHSDPYWRLANLALQFRLGLLPVRRPRIGFGYSSDSGAIGSGLASVFTGANGRLESVYASSTPRLSDSDLCRTGEILPIIGGYSGG